MAGVDAKPAGANFYPADATREEVEAAPEAVRSQYSMVRRDDAGNLVAVPYRDAFAEQVDFIARVH